MKFKSSIGWILYLFFMVILLSHCAKHLSIAVRGSQDLNSGGYPVTVYIYQLVSDQNFQITAHESFWQDDKAALGEDLLERVEIRLHPNEVKSRIIKIHKLAKYLGVSANFAKPKQNFWRKIILIEEYRNKDIVISVDVNSVAIQSL